MTARVLESIGQHEMFGAGHRVGVAVSGGADSVCLLHVLRELAPYWNLQLAVVHVEHGIRGRQSLDDADFASALAQEFGFEFHLRHANLTAADDNLEQAARDARRSFFLELLGTGRLDRIATGHTLEDQAETVMYRILRGTGLPGLASILPVTREGIVRPLLEIRRVEIEAWLRERGIAWREDETNRDTRFVRNRIRHELLPHLSERYNPQVIEILAHFATMARDEEKYWEQHLGPAPNKRDGAFLIVTRELTTVPPALARRVIRRAIQTVKGNLRQIGFGHVEAILALARQTEGSGRFQIPAVDVYRSFDWLRLAPPGIDQRFDRDFAVPASVPGSVDLPDRGIHVEFQFAEPRESGQAYDRLGDELDWQRLTSETSAGNAEPGLLEVRNWRPGDRYRRLGKTHDEKIKLLFQENRIPLWERRNWPVLTWRGTIVWARRFGVAAEFAATPESRMVLRVHEKAANDR